MIGRSSNGGPAGPRRSSSACGVQIMEIMQMMQIMERMQITEIIELSRRVLKRVRRVGGIDDAGEGRWDGFWSQPGEPTSPGHMN